MIACDRYWRIVVAEGVGDKWPVETATVEKGVADKIEGVDSQVMILVEDRIDPVFRISWADHKSGSLEVHWVVLSLLSAFIAFELRLSGTNEGSSHRAVRDCLARSLVVDWRP